ncbi:MAG TPA: hypothetical protein VGU20_19620, partial [Stellaceae bacterium]|nr:hypothetical protein [Stellaceae bacterium]
LLQKQIGNAEEVKDIRETAEEVADKWVVPLGSGAEQTNGLISGVTRRDFLPRRDGVFSN